MRLLLLALALTVCAPTAALAQDAPKPAKKKVKKPEKAPRIQIDASEQLDKQNVKPRGLQYLMWYYLTYYARMRVDAPKPMGRKSMDKAVKRFSRWWDKHYTLKEHPVELKFVATQKITYNASIFYGKPQAHNFKGAIKAQLEDADGNALATWAFKFHWGKAVGPGRSKSDVHIRYNQIVHTALCLMVIDHEQIRKRVPKNKLANLEKVIKAEKARLLKVFDNPKATKAIRQGELAKLVRKIGTKASKGTKKPGAK